MANRYDTPYEHTPISQYVPLPLKDIQEGYKYQQETYDKGMAALADEPIVPSGPTTRNHAKMLQDQIDQHINDMASDALKNNTVGQLPYKMSAYKKQITGTPLWNALEEDKLLGSKIANETIVAPGNEYFVQGFYDPNTKELKQQDVNKLPSLGYYNTVTPYDFHKDHADFNSGIKDNLTKTAGESGRYADEIPGSVDPKTGQPQLGWYDIRTKGLIKGVTRKDVKKVADEWVKDPTLWSTRPSVLYKDKRKQQLTNGESYSPEEYSSDLVNQYIGYHAEESDEESRQQLKGQGSGSRSINGSGSSSGDPDNRPKEIFQRMNDEGGTKVDAKESAAILGGNVNKDGVSVNIPITGRSVYFSTGKGSSKEDFEKNILMGKAVKHFGMLNQAIPALKNPVGDSENDLPSFMVQKLSKSDKNSKYYATPDGVIYKKDANGSVKLGLAKKVFDDNKNNEKMFPEYKKIKEQALKDGIDLDNNKTKELVNSSVPEESSDFLSKMLDNLHGQVDFTPSPNKGLITDDNGDVLASGTITMTEDQIKKSIPDETYWFNFLSSGGYKKLERDGLIKKIPAHTIQDENNKTVSIPDSYEFNATIPLNGQDVNNMTRNIIVNNAGGVQNEYTDKTVKAKIAEVNNTIFTNKTYKKYDAYNKAIQSSPDKSISILDKEINDLIAGKPTVDIKGEVIYPSGLDHNSPSYNQDIADINALKVSTMESNKSKFEKAKVLLQIKHKLADANAYDLLYKNNESSSPQYQGQRYGGSDMGKYQPQQDKSNPLGI